MAVVFPRRILAALATVGLTAGAIHLAICKYRSLTVEDLLRGERRKILGENDGDEWNRKLNDPGLKDAIGEKTLENLKAKCKELLGILLVDVDSLEAEDNARRWCVGDR